MTRVVSLAVCHLECVDVPPLNQNQKQKIWSLAVGMGTGSLGSSGFLTLTIPQSLEVTLNLYYLT